MKYEVRHNNQVWHVFNTDLYKAVEAFNNKQDAVELVRRLNSGVQSL